MNSDLSLGGVSEAESRVRRGRARMAGDLAEGGSGIEACRALSQTYDCLVRSFWEGAMELLPQARSAGFALVALGGWGREEICPYSDIDFVILANAKSDVLANDLADSILYPLWDAKIKVGHAVRSCRDAAALAREDLPTATALLDARLVVGDANSFAELQRSTRRSVAPGGNANTFMQMLSDERERRYDRYGESLHLLEPNIKQGIGGLRDYSTAHWAARARWSVSGLGDLVGIGELTKRQHQVLRGGLDFLLQIRSLLQLEAGRSTDLLSFEIQEAIAPELFPYATAPEGRIVPAVAPAVETLMRKYYLVGRGLERLANRVMEGAVVPARRKPRIRKIDRSFLSWNGKLAVCDPRVFAEQPPEMLRYFRVALEHDLPLYGHTKELIEAQVAENGHLLAGDALSAQYFLSALTDVSDVGRGSRHSKTLLRQMHSLGLLAAVMPEFAPCTARVQHDLYHVYTVDHHQIAAVELLKKTGRGQLGAEGEVAMRAYRRVPSTRALYLATLLHDVGKPLGAGHAETGAKIAATIAIRLGLGEAEVAMVAFLVRQHLSMSHISQRRDLSDPDVIRKFAVLVGSEAALHNLFLLTRCDTAMTAPGNLSSWKDQLLSELYLRTMDELQGEGAMQSEQALHRRQARRRAVEIVSEQGREPLRAARADSIVDKLDPGFVNALSARQLSRLIECALLRVDTGDPVAIAVHLLAGKGQTELVCVSEDSPAVLSNVAGVLAAHRVVIDAASIATVETSSGEWAMQVFVLRDRHQRAILEDDKRWPQVRADLQRVMESEARGVLVAEMLADCDERYDEGYSAKPGITAREDSQIKIFDEESSACSVVEVHTTDATALLHHVTAVMASHGLDIHRAMVSTEGDRVADVFYVTFEGAKLTSAQCVSMNDLLLSVLADLR